MSGTLMPVPTMQWFGDDGAPLTNGLVYTYAAGTSTPLSTFKDFALTVPNTNPIYLDAEGKAVIYFSAANYKIDVQTSAGVSIDSYPRDNVPGLIAVSAANITGQVSVAQGGTGVATLTAHGVLVGNGTSPVNVTAVGAAGQVLTSNGAGLDPTYQSFTTVINRQNTAQQVINTNAETALYTFSIPGNTLGITNTIRFSVTGDQENNTGGNVTYIFRLKYGATTIASFTFANVNTAGVQSGFTLDAELSSGGLTNLQYSKAILIFDGVGENNSAGLAITKDYVGGAGGSALLAGGSVNYAIHNNIAEDSTLAKSLTFTVQLSVASNSLNCRCLNAYTELK